MSNKPLCDYYGCTNTANTTYGADYSPVCDTHRLWKPGAICARCGKPAKGWAMIDGERYCHEGVGATCFMEVSWKLAPLEAFRNRNRTPNKDAVRSASPGKSYADMSQSEAVQYLSGLDAETLERLGGFPDSDKAGVFTPDMAYAEGCRRGKQDATSESYEAGKQAEREHVSRVLHQLFKCVAVPDAYDPRDRTCNPLCPCDLPEKILRELERGEHE